jgi:hypothetical protein
MHKRVHLSSLRSPRTREMPIYLPQCQVSLSLRSGQFRGQKSLGPLEKRREMPHYMFYPRKKIISRTFIISGTLIVKTSCVGRKICKGERGKRGKCERKERKKENVGGKFELRVSKKNQRGRKRLHGDVNIGLSREWGGRYNFRSGRI